MPSATRAAQPAIHPTNTLAPQATDTAIPTATLNPSSTPTPTPESRGLATECQAANLPELACTGVQNNQAWSPLIQTFDGIPMVLVPAGCFMMGYEHNLPEEAPVHEICFDQPFWIDLTEVTVAQFSDFLNAQSPPVDTYAAWLNVQGFVDPPHIQLVKEADHWAPVPDDAQRPLEFVTWFGASDYCAWRSARLPTEAEWEYAARGPDSLLYPWGNELIWQNVVRPATKNPEVGSKPEGASWVGALDLSGSLFEWTSSLYWPYPYDASDGREASRELDPTGDRVFRGSAWYHPIGMHDNVSAPARFNNPPNIAFWNSGFRCARSLDP